jgi:hypothetical protein
MTAEAWRELVGWRRNGINNRIDYDNRELRKWLAEFTGDDRLLEGVDEPDAIDAELFDSKTSAPTRGELVRWAGPAPSGLAALEMAFGAIAQKQLDASLLVHKHVLSLREARTLSGLSLNDLRPFCRFKGGRYVITQDELKKAVVAIWKKAPTEAPLTPGRFKTILGGVPKKKAPAKGRAKK